MSSISDNLSRLEIRLQTLIEEGARRIFPGGDNLTHISISMAEAMHNNLYFDQAGNIIAPDLFILVVDPQTANLMAEDPSLIKEFSQLIQQSSNQAGLRFLNQPRIKISADPSQEPGRIKVIAQFSLQEKEETSTLSVNSEEAIPVPEYAFLILKGTEVFPLTQQVVNIGRRVDNHVVIEDLRVSRVHAQIRAIKSHYIIFDLDSSGGTFVNGVRIAQTTLYPGDVISLAGVDLVYGQDAAYVSNGDQGSTQPLIPFPQSD